MKKKLLNKFKFLHYVSFIHVTFITECTNATVTGITESKLKESIFQSEIQIDNYNLFRCDRNRNDGGVVYYIRSDIKYVR